MQSHFSEFNLHAIFAEESFRKNNLTQKRLIGGVVKPDQKTSTDKFIDLQSAIFQLTKLAN